MKRYQYYITITEAINATINMVDCTIAIETMPSVQIHWSRIGKDLMKLGRAIASVVCEVACDVMVRSDVLLGAVSLAGVVVRS